MTVHATLLLVETTPQSDGLETAYQNAKDNRTLVLPGQASDLTTVEDRDLDIVYRLALHRWDGAEDQIALIDDIESAVPTGAWYKVYHHDCDHDADAPAACPGWVLERSGNNPPDVGP